MAFKGTGEWFDLEDLEDKYENKPEQLQSILEEARRFKCSVRNVTLYEDMTYQSVVEVSETRVNKAGRQYQALYDGKGKKGKGKGPVTTASPAAVEDGLPVIPEEPSGRSTKPHKQSCRPPLLQQCQR